MFYLKQYNKTLLQFEIIEDNLDGQKVDNIREVDNLDTSLLPIGVEANLSEYAKTRRSSYGVPFENVVKEFITSRQKAKLRKMIGFKFERNKTYSYNWPAKRLKAIEGKTQQNEM